MDKKEILKITKNLPDIIGVAPNAFSRVITAEYFPNYSIVCFKYRRDTNLIASDIPVYCVEKENPSTAISKMNAAEMLALPGVRRYINGKNNPHLLVYKPTTGIDAVLFETGWKIIGNSSTVKYDIENKLAFRSLLKKAGIEAISGETVLFSQLNEELFKEMVARMGENLVFQVAEITTGGGTGTAFINSISDFRAFMERFRAKKEKLVTIEHVNITKFIKGIPTSILACATKYGVITGQVQTQILDIPQVRDLSEGSGLFSGHDFAYGDFDEEVNTQASLLAKKFGEYIYKNLGYKGIFGLDLITDPAGGRVYPVECNPRYTDAFPLISQIHMGGGAVPMDVYHIFEHMNIDYKIDVDEISSSYKTKIKSSQILLETKTSDWTKVKGDLKAGVYKINRPDDSQKTNISYQRAGYRFSDLNSSDEFLVTEGVPFKDTVFKGGSRILRLIFSKSILKSPNSLSEEAVSVINKVYEILSLEKCPPQILLQDFLGLKVGEIPSPGYLKSAQDLGADIVNLTGIDEGFGYVRPDKIVWRMDLTKNSPIACVRSKRLKKHLKNWILNMDKYGLKHEIIMQLSSKQYILWFNKIFSLLSSKEKANIKINPNWLTYKMKIGKKVGGIFLYKGKKFLGGNIFTYSDEKFSVGYGAVSKIKNPNWSLGAIADFLSAECAAKLCYKSISFGKDNNLYGYHLSTGLLQYKLNFGLVPSYKSTAEIYSTKIISADKFANSIAFLGVRNGKSVFYVLEKVSTSDDLKLNTDIEVIRKRF